ncbi:MAG: T9SS type A sorting domain-containing protein [Paludibacteraceae bacterium]|nr:T9SS type A sorting domain-containing protein [Paludibacteraceae bacterium]MBR4706328.1 T9SS type A sorting domain-containing protein [Paludibacteraceae bacterium]
MKKSLFFVIALIIGITHMYADNAVFVFQGDTITPELGYTIPCMGYQDTLVVKIDRTLFTPTRINGWSASGELKIIEEDKAGLDSVHIYSTGVARGGITINYDYGKCSGYSQGFIINKTFHPDTFKLTIEGPECIIDTQRVVYSVKPILTKNLGANIGIDSYIWNVLQTPRPNFVDSILYVSGDTSSVTFRVGHVDPDNLPTITVSVGACNINYPLTLELGNSTPKPEIIDTMYYTVGKESFKVGVTKPDTALAYTWTCKPASSFTIEPFGKGDSAIIYIEDGGEKATCEVFVSAQYKRIQCNTSADTMVVMRTWGGDVYIEDSTKIGGACYSVNLVDTPFYIFTVKGSSIPIETSFDWVLPQGWNFRNGIVSNGKTISIYPDRTARLVDTLLVKPLNPNDHALPDSFVVYIKPDTIPSIRIKQDSCLAYNHEGAIYVDTTGMHMPEGVEFEWDVSDSIKGESGGTDTLRFTPNANITSVQVKAKGFGGCDGEYTSHYMAYKPQKPNSIVWIDSACVSYGIQDNLEFAIANPLQNQKYRWQAPNGWEIVTDTTGGFVTHVEMTTNGVAGEHTIYVRGVNDRNEQCLTSDAESRKVVIPNYIVTIVPIPGAGYIVFSVSGQTPTIESAYLYENGMIIEGAISSALNYVVINQAHSRKDEFLALGDLTNNPTFSIEITMSLPNDCRLKYIYGAPLNNGQHQIIRRAFLPAKKQLTSNDKLSISPNPAYTELTISLSDIEDSIVDVFVLSTDGKILKTIRNSPIRSSIDVADLPQGTYLLSVTCKGKPYSTIFMKQ